RHLVALPVEQHRHRAVIDAGRNHAPEELHHLFGARARRDVPVVAVLLRALRAPAFELREQLIAHAATDDPARVAGLGEPPAEVTHLRGDRPRESIRRNSHFVPRMRKERAAPVITPKGLRFLRYRASGGVWRARAPPSSRPAAERPRGPPRSVQARGRARARATPVALA